MHAQIKLKTSYFSCNPALGNRTAQAEAKKHIRFIWDIHGKFVVLFCLYTYAIVYVPIHHRPRAQPKPSPARRATGPNAACAQTASRGRKGSRLAIGTGARRFHTPGEAARARAGGGRTCSAPGATRAPGTRLPGVLCAAPPLDRSRGGKKDPNSIRIQEHACGVRCAPTATACSMPAVVPATARRLLPDRALVASRWPGPPLHCAPPLPRARPLGPLSLRSQLLFLFCRSIQ